MQTSIPDKAVHGFTMPAFWPNDKTNLSKEDFAAALNVTNEEVSPSTIAISIMPSDADQLIADVRLDLPITSSSLAQHKTELLNSNDPMSAAETIRLIVAVIGEE